jgi:CDP-diacylglycerol--glycerol-3-phosphate 3-phosphatidyltransferase
MRINLRKEQIPWVMAAGRGVLGPVLIAGAACSWNGVTLAGIVVTALISDIYDGVLARRWSCDTAGVRLLDSMADTLFYLCTAVAFWICQPQLWRSYGGLLVALLGLEVARFVFDFAKFGKPASYHSYLAKSWGLVLAVAAVGVFALGRANVLILVALGMGILCDLEGLAMSVVLPVWRKDVKTIRTAWRIRGEMLGDGGGNGSGRTWSAFVVGVSSAVVLGLLVGVPAFAVEAGQVAYVSGTISVPQGMIGSFDTDSAPVLVFKYAVPGGGPREVEIAYKNIGEVEYSTEVAHHLGVLPAVAVSLVKRRERKHFFTFKFTDSAGLAQAAIFEVPKNDPPGLLAVLNARAPQACGMQKMNCGVKVRQGGGAGQFC